MVRGKRGEGWGGIKPRIVKQSSIHGDTETSCSVRALEGKGEERKEKMRTMSW